MPEDAYVEWLREGLRQPKTQTGLAQALGITQPQISRILAYERKIKLSEIPKIAAYLESQPPDRAHLTVPVVGEVGAGDAAHFYAKAQGPFGDAPAPEGATDDTVALEVRGESLGSFFDDWLVYYDEVRRPVTPDLHGRLCVVGLDDDRVLIKKIKASPDKRRFHLLSLTEDPILDVVVVWAARVKHMAPK